MENVCTLSRLSLRNARKVKVGSCSGVDVVLGVFDGCVQPMMIE